MGYVPTIFEQRARRYGYAMQFLSVECLNIQRGQDTEVSSIEFQAPSHDERIAVKCSFVRSLVVTLFTLPGLQVDKNNDLFSLD